MTTSDETYLNATDQKQVILVGRWMGLASMLGSTYIILLIAGSAVDREAKLNKSSFYRFLLLLSIFDVISSFGYFLSTFMIPEEPPPGMEESIGHIYDYDDTFPWATGNQATCTFQGFLIHVGMSGSVLFTGFISLHYVFVVRYRWGKDKMRRMEIICYILGLIIPFGAAVYLAIMGLFNPYVTGFCWINQYPGICAPYDKEADESGAVEDYCNDFGPDLVTSEEANTAILIFAYPLIGGVFLVVVVSMGLLYHSIQSQERQLMSSSSNNHHQQRRQSTFGNKRNTKISRQAIKKAMLLISNYVVMYVPVIIASGMYTKASSLVTVIFLSSQGVLNAFVYSGMAEWCLDCPSRLCHKMLGNDAEETANQDKRIRSTKIETNKSADDDGDDED